MKHLSQFIDRTKGTEQDYKKWATECGIKASHSFKDRQLGEKFMVKLSRKEENLLRKRLSQF